MYFCVHYRPESQPRPAPDQPAAGPSSGAEVVRSSSGVPRLSSSSRRHLHQPPRSNRLSRQSSRIPTGEPVSQLRARVSHVSPTARFSFGKLPGWAKSNMSAAGGGKGILKAGEREGNNRCCLLYTSPSPRDMRRSRMPSSA